jgi:hypothetical protein
MARVVSNQVESSSPVGGGQELPSLSPISPVSEATISPIEPVAVGLPEIQYNMSTADRAMKEIASLQVSLNYVNVGLQLTDLTNQKNQMSDAYLKDHPDGRGYAQYMTDGYKNLLKEKIENAPNRDIGNMLQQYMNHSLPQIQETALRKELQIGTNYGESTTGVTLDVLLNQMVVHPEDEPLIREQYAAALTSMKGILSPSEYEKYARNAWDKYGTILGETMIVQDPAKALRYFKSGALTGMVKGYTAIKLIKTAIAQAEAMKNRYLRDQKLQKLEGKKDQIEKTLGLKTGNSTPVDVNALDLPEKAKNTILSYQKELDNFSEKQIDTQDEILTAYFNDEPIDGYSSDEVNVAYRGLVVHKMITERRDATDEEKAWIAINGRFSGPLHDLNRDLVIDLERGAPNEALSAANAMKVIEQAGKQVVIKNMPLKNQAMAIELREKGIYAGSDPKQLAALVSEVREKYKLITPEQMKFSEAMFSNIKRDDIFGMITSDIKHPFSPFYDKLTPHTKSQLIMDAHKALKFIYGQGITDPDTAQTLMNSSLLKEWGPTKVAPSGPFFHSETVMKYPPELMYPQYAGTPYLKNSFFNDVQAIVKENERVLGEHSDVKLIEPLLKKFSEEKELSQKDLSQKDLTNKKIPEIHAKVDGKWQKRKIFIENDPFNKYSYLAYWLYEEGNFLTKRSLKFSKDVFASSIGF